MVGLPGCRKQDDPSRAAALQAPPPPEVDWALARIEPIQDFREYTGRTAAFNAVEVRARVGGYLRQSPQSTQSERFDATSGTGSATKKTTTYPISTSSSQGSDSDDVIVTAKEGDFIQKGTLLFQIDREPYELALRQAEGSLAAARAQAKRFESDLERADRLRGSNAITQAEYDQALATLAEVDGRIKNLEATIDRAKLDLQFTRVVAPIDGLLGSTYVTNGNLITADQTVLTTIVSIEPIYVWFDVDEHSLLDYRERIRKGAVKSSRDEPIEIRMQLANEKDFPHTGVIDFVDNTTSSQTGNTRIRAVFANRNRELSPGLFARILSPFSDQYDAVLVPTKAISMDQQGRFVFEVIDNQVVRRSVTLGEIHGDSTVVKIGLNGGETIIVSGLQKVRPGAEVKLSAPKPETKTDN